MSAIDTWVRFRRFKSRISARINFSAEALSRGRKLQNTENGRIGTQEVWRRARRQRPTSLQAGNRFRKTEPPILPYIRSLPVGKMHAMEVVPRQALPRRIHNLADHNPTKASVRTPMRLPSTLRKTYWPSSSLGSGRFGSDGTTC